jgi:hypothetical protein
VGTLQEAQNMPRQMENSPSLYNNSFSSKVLDSQQKNETYSLQKKPSKAAFDGPHYS